MSPCVKRKNREGRHVRGCVSGGALCSAIVDCKVVNNSIDGLDWLSILSRGVFLVNGGHV